MGSSRRSIVGALAAMLLCLGCGDADDGADTAGAAGPTVESVSTTAMAESSSTDAIDVTEPPTTETTVVDSQTTSTADDDEADPESDDHRGPALASVDEFIASWAAVAAASDTPDLMPTISSADVELDPTIGVDAFVEQATPATVIGGIADPDTGIVTGLMGLSDSAGSRAAIMIEIIWAGAFGTDDGATLTEYFPAGDLETLDIGEQVTRVHRDKSIVLSHVGGATPDEGLYVFTIGTEELLTDDPSHDSITNVVLGLLVRTS